MTGTVKWFRPDRGYGFIGGDDGCEYFVHQTEILMCGYRTLEEGQRVEFDPDINSRGRIAVAVMVKGG